MLNSKKVKSSNMLSSQFTVDSSKTRSEGDKDLYLCFTFELKNKNERAKEGVD